jgi:CubicO group peptidase (beta-lactamase class C family)
VLDPERLDCDLQAELVRRRVPGLAAAAVVRGERLLYARGFGVTSTGDAGLAVTPETLLRVASAPHRMISPTAPRF